MAPYDTIDSGALDTERGSRMQVKVLGVLELGTLNAKIVEDPQGRKCIAMTIGERDVCFTISQALLIRQMLDAGIDAMLKYTRIEEAPDGAQEGWDRR